MSFSSFRLALPLLLALVSMARADDDVTTLLAKDLQERVITISEPVYVYHWFPKGNIHSPYEPVAANAAPNDRTPRDFSANELDWLESAVSGKVHGMVARFWNETSPYGLVGAGVYCARDPLSSSRYGQDPEKDYRGYAGNDAVLVSFRMDSGAKLFDLRADPAVARDSSEPYRYGNQIYIRPATTEKLKEVGCVVAPDSSYRDGWLANPKCAPLFAAALRTLGVVGNVHSWWGGGAKGCRTSPDAFVLLDGEYFDSASRTRVYTWESIRAKNPSIFPNAEERQSEWQAILSFARDNGDSDLREGSPDQFKSYFGLTNDDLATSRSFDSDAWNKKHLFHCEEKNESESVRLPSWKTVPKADPAPAAAERSPASQSRRVNKRLDARIAAVQAEYASRADKRFSNDRMEEVHRLLPKFLYDRMLIEHDVPVYSALRTSAKHWLEAESYVTAYTGPIDVEFFREIGRITMREQFFWGYEERRIKAAIAAGTYSAEIGAAALKKIMNEPVYFTGVDHATLGGVIRHENVDNWFYRPEQRLPDGTPYLTAKELKFIRANPYFVKDENSIVEFAPGKFSGTIRFADASRVPGYVSDVITRTNDAIAATKKPRLKLLAVARAMRDLLTIHPFLDGNGRSIRLLGDAWLERAGFPPPLLLTENELMISAEEYAEIVLEGMELYLRHEIPAKEKEAS